MALKIDAFERGANLLPNGPKRPGRNQEMIIRVLKINAGAAYTQSEIQHLLEVKFPSAINSALHSLLSKGCVDVRTVEGIQYWRFVKDVPQIRDGEGPQVPEIKPGDLIGEANSPKSPANNKREPGKGVSTTVKGTIVGGLPDNKKGNKNGHDSNGRGTKRHKEVGT